MAKNKVEKRKFIEDIFGMEVFSRMISSLRQEYNELKKDHEVHLSRLDEIHNYTKTYNTQRDLVINRREEKLKLYKERQSNNKDNLRTLLVERNNALVDDNVLINAELIIHKLDNKLCECDNKINNIREVSGGKRVEVKLLIDTYKKIGTDTQKCPVCLKSIDDHDKEVINQEKVKLKADIAIFKDEIDALAESLEKIILIKEKTKKAIQVKSNDLNNIKLKINNTNNINQKIDQINKWQEELIEDIASINISNTEFDDLIKETEERLLELEETVKVCAKKISQLDIVKYVVSEEGVKSYIVNKLLELLNSKLFFYIKKLDSNSVCIFNEYFEEKILNEQNKVCSYFNFSGAERKSIDLACLFTFSDIRRVQGGVSYNIAIYDELFDSSFDEKGIELITDILKERVEMFNECAIVISHRKESVKAVTGEVIYLEKSKGITRRVNYSDY
jgi:DNA repair exonuclease SbcCD ATPase subunit